MRNFLALIFSSFLFLTSPSFAASQTMQVGPIFSSVQDDRRSYLRFYNTSNVAGSVTLIVRNALTGEELGEWTTPIIEPNEWQQYWIATIEGAISFPFGRPEHYLIEVKSKFAGQFQHVVVNTKSSVLINLSSCSTGTALSTGNLTGVHSSNIGVQGYPSYVVVSNLSSTSYSNVTLDIFDAQTAIKVGTYETGVIAKNSQLRLSVNDIERVIGQPQSSVYHYTIKANSTFSGFLTHLVFNEVTGVVTDLTPTCTISLPAPLPVLRSSYENKMVAGKLIGPEKIQPHINGKGEWVSTGYAFADFFQEGEYSVVTNTIRQSTPTARPDLPATIKFWKKNKDGIWEDHTSKILKDQTGCLEPRKTLVADFNGDKKPDVFFVCTGYDLPPWLGENQRMLLSKSDGSYENKIVPHSAYAHGGSAADVTGDGFADVVLTDTSQTRKQPFYLKNNRDGTFSEIAGRMPESARVVGSDARSIYTAEFIDINKDGKYDLWLGGVISGDTYEFMPTMYINDGSYAFKDTSKYSHSSRHSLLATGIAPVALDVVVIGQDIYTLFATANYAGVHIEKTTYASDRNTVVYQHLGTWGDWTQTWFPWLIEYNGQVVPSDEVYPVTVK